MVSEARLLYLIQRRSLTILVVMGAVMVTLSVLFAALRSREATCQESVHEVSLPVFLKGTLSNATLFDTILTVLSRENLNVRLRVHKNDSTHVGAVTMLDTPQGTLLANGLRVFTHRNPTYPDTTTLHVSDVSTTLCGHVPAVSLDLDYNVDKDVMLTKRMSTMINGSRTFIVETQLRTQELRRLTQFSDLETLCAGMRELKVAFGVPLVTKAALSYMTVTSSPILSARGGVTPLVLVVERWDDDHQQRSFWKLLLKTNSPYAEYFLQTVYAALSTATRKWQVDPSSLGVVTELR